MKVDTRSASSCHLYCAMRSCAFYTCRRTMASSQRCAVLRSDYGGREYVATSRRLFEFAKFAIEIAARIQIPARYYGSFPPTIHSQFCTLTSSADKAQFHSAPNQNLFCRLLMASQAEPRPFQSMINALSQSRTPCTPNKLRVTSSRNKFTLIATRFESALFEELCIAFGIDKTRTMPYPPQANGKCKRFNRTLITMIRRAVQKRPDDWKPFLPAVLQAYRSTHSVSTGFTPFRLAIGREMRLGVDIGTPLPEPLREIRT